MQGEKVKTETHAKAKQSNKESEIPRRQNPPDEQQASWSLRTKDGVDEKSGIPNPAHKSGKRSGQTNEAIPASPHSDQSRNGPKPVWNKLKCKELCMKETFPRACQTNQNRNKKRATG